MPKKPEVIAWMIALVVTAVGERDVPSCREHLESIISSGDLDDLKKLLNNQEVTAFINNSKFSEFLSEAMLRTALESGRVEIVKFLLSKNEDGTPCFPKITLQGILSNSAVQPQPLCIITAKGYVEMLQYLLILEEQGELNGVATAVEENMLLTACKSGCVNMVEFLLSKHENGEPLFPKLDPQSIVSNLESILSELDTSAIILLSQYLLDLEQKNIISGVKLSLDKNEIYQSTMYEQDKLNAMAVSNSATPLPRTSPRQ